MSDYLQDLVQNIYTNCDMSGFDDYNKAINNLNRNFNQTTRERIRLSELEAKSRIRVAHYNEKYALKNERLHFQENSLLARKMWLWHRLVRLIGIYFGVNTIRNIIRTGSELQLIQKSITGLTGSGQDWQFLDQQAYKFGLSLKTVSQGYKNFYSSASMAGVGKGQIQQMYSDLLLGARSIGASDQQIGGALLALEQIYSKGRVSMEELRRQLGNALPGAFEIGAKAMGVTTAQFNEMIKAGISAQDFVPKFIKTFKEQYQNGWKDVEQTVAVAQGRLLESWEKFTMNFMHGESGKALAQGINRLAEFMRSPIFYQFVNLLGKIFTLIVKLMTFAIKHIRLITVLLVSGGILGAMKQIYGLTRLISIAFQLMTSGKIIWGLKLLTNGFWGLNAPIIALYAKILLIIGALLLLEDMYTGIFHPEKDSLTKKAGVVDFTKGMANNPVPLVNPYGAVGAGFGVAGKIYKMIQPKIIPDAKGTNPNSINQGGVNYEKNENKDLSINFGDIYIQGTNASADEVGEIFEQKLVALFMGQGLMTNVNDMVGA